jgi:hypothetical protein
MQGLIWGKPELIAEMYTAHFKLNELSGLKLLVAKAVSPILLGIYYHIMHADYIISLKIYSFCLKLFLADSDQPTAVYALNQN